MDFDFCSKLKHVFSRDILQECGVLYLEWKKQPNSWRNGGYVCPIQAWAPGWNQVHYCGSRYPYIYIYIWYCRWIMEDVLWHKKYGKLKVRCKKITTTSMWRFKKPLNVQSWIECCKCRCTLYFHQQHCPRISCREYRHYDKSVSKEVCCLRYCWIQSGSFGFLCQESFGKIKLLSKLP